MVWLAGHPQRTQRSIRRLYDFLGKKDGTILRAHGRRLQRLQEWNHGTHGGRLGTLLEPRLRLPGAALPMCPAKAQGKNSAGNRPSAQTILGLSELPQGKERGNPRMQGVLL